MLLAIVMVVGLMPGFTVTASAADAIAWTDSDGDGVQDSGEKTWDCLSDALEAGGTVRMLNNYQLTDDAGYDEKYYFGQGAYYQAARPSTFYIWMFYSIIRTWKRRDISVKEKVLWIYRGKKGYCRMLGYEAFKKGIAEGKL